MAKVRKTATTRAAKRAAKPSPGKPARAKPRPPPTSARTKPTAKRPAARRARAALPRRTARGAPRDQRAPTSPGGAVVRILDEADPRAALRAMLDGIDRIATVQQGQIALGAAQLMLSSVERGSAEAGAIVDLVVSRWALFPERSGFYAQEFLRNAFAAAGADRDRIAQLATLVPIDPSPELRFNIACAHALAGDRSAMLREIEAALAIGVAPAQIVRERDLAAYADDPRLRELLERASAPAIPIDIEPHLPTVRAALDAVVATVRELGEVATLEPPASLDAVVAAEHPRGIQLPNDYRALLTLCDGMTLWNLQFLGTRDHRGDTRLANAAREYLELSASYGATGIDDCVPLANWGQPNDWLLYDPRGRFRSGEPGYVLMLNADECPLDGLVHALERFERIAREVLGAD